LFLREREREREKTHTHTHPRTHSHIGREGDKQDSSPRIQLNIVFI